MTWFGQARSHAFSPFPSKMPPCLLRLSLFQVSSRWHSGLPKHRVLLGDTQAEARDYIARYCNSSSGQDSTHHHKKYRLYIRESRAGRNFPPWIREAFQSAMCVTLTRTHLPGVSLDIITKSKLWVTVSSPSNSAVQYIELFFSGERITVRIVYQVFTHGQACLPTYFLAKEHDFSAGVITTHFDKNQCHLFFADYITIPVSKTRSDEKWHKPLGVFTWSWPSVAKALFILSLGLLIPPN